jgi:hypothetical protein
MWKPTTVRSARQARWVRSKIRGRRIRMPHMERPSSAKLNKALFDVAIAALAVLNDAAKAVD